MTLADILDVLAFAGNVVDTPGAAARGVAGGIGDLAQMLLGYQEEAPNFHLEGILDPSKRVYGRDLLRDWGAIGEEDTWGNFAAGLGVDFALDPLNLLPLLPYIKGIKATKAVKAATKANRAAQEVNLAVDAAKALKGERSALAAAKFAEREKIRNIMRAPEIPQGIPEGVPEDVVKQMHSSNPKERAAGVYRAIMQGETRNVPPASAADIEELGPLLYNRIPVNAFTNPSAPVPNIRAGVLPSLSDMIYVRNPEDLAFWAKEGAESSHRPTDLGKTLMHEVTHRMNEKYPDAANRLADVLGKDAINKAARRYYGYSDSMTPELWEEVKPTRWWDEGLAELIGTSHRGPAKSSVESFLAGNPVMDAAEKLGDSIRLTSDPFGPFDDVAKYKAAAQVVLDHLAGNMDWRRAVSASRMSPDVDWSILRSRIGRPTPGIPSQHVPFQPIPKRPSMLPFYASTVPGAGATLWEILNESSY